MWQRLRDYWLPRMLFLVTQALAGVLLLLVALAPLVTGAIGFSNRMLELYADDATVRRISVAGAIGLFVTAVVFFRPRPAPPPKKPPPMKPPRDTIAGA
jgi:hypothetical protein